MTFRLLLSFHYYRDVDLDDFLGKFPERPDVFVDSGAYSAKSLGEAIDIAAYARWVQRWQGHITAFANLDVIGDPVRTATNQQRMEDLGVRPLPVYHALGDWRLDFDHLAGLCERYSYVCLGGLVGERGFAALMPWLVQAFQTAARTGTRFHGFGQTRAEVLRDLPWYSLDSSSWGSVYRYGGLNLWDDRTNTWAKVALRDRQAVIKHRDLIRSYGEAGAFVATAGNKHDPTRVPRAERARLARMSAVAWQRYEAYLQRRHHVTPPAGWDGEGPRVYLATEARFTNGTLDGLTMGPKVYLVDGQPYHLLMGAGVSDPSIFEVRKA